MRIRIKIRTGLSIINLIILIAIVLSSSSCQLIRKGNSTENDITSTEDDKQSIVIESEEESNDNIINVETNEKETMDLKYKELSFAYISLTGSAYGIEVPGHGYCVEKYTGKDTQIFIPSEYYDKNSSKAFFGIIEKKPVIEISAGAFRDMTQIESVSCSENIVYIGAAAFKGCTGLASIFIPSKACKISASAFEGCKNLTSITGNATTTMEIAKQCEATSFCVTITSGTIIEATAFYCTGLTSITIPETVTSIANLALSSCKKLMTINYNGTKAQWENIDKAPNWDNDSGEYIINCKDGTIGK